MMRLVVSYLIPCLVLLSFPFQTSSATNYKVAVINREAIQPYLQALEGFNNTCKATDIDYFLIDKNPSRVIKKVRSSSPNLILTIGTKASTIAYHEIKDIPIVFAMVSRPVKYGLVGNITGACLNIPITKQFEILTSILPHIKRIGVVYNPKETEELINEARIIARDMGLTLIPSKVSSPKDVPKAVEALKGKIDALWMTVDRTVANEKAITYLIVFAYDQKIPFMGLSEEYTKAGTLLSLTPDYKDIGRQAGELANQILDGKDPSELKVRTPEDTRLSLNLKTAEIIGIKLPKEVINMAKEIYR